MAVEGNNVEVSASVTSDKQAGNAGPVPAFERPARVSAHQSARRTVSFHVNNWPQSRRVLHTSAPTTCVTLKTKLTLQGSTEPCKDWQPCSLGVIAQSASTAPEAASAVETISQSGCSCCVHIQCMEGCKCGASIPPVINGDGAHLLTPFKYARAWPQGRRPCRRVWRHVALHQPGGPSQQDHERCLPAFQLAPEKLNLYEATTRLEEGG